MKKFLIQLLYFILPLIVLAWPLDYGISYILKHSNRYPGEFNVWNDIYDHDAQCDIAIYGSSRAWVQIDPEIISKACSCKVYNFGMDGHNFWLQYLRHIELLKHNKKPREIVLSADIFSLQKRAALCNPEQFLPYMLWNEDIRHYTESYEGYDRPEYSIPLLRYLGKRKALETCVEVLYRGIQNSQYRKNGYLGMNREWNSDFDNAKESNEKYIITFDKPTILLFEQFVRECNENGIKLTVIYAPEYIEGQSYVANRNELMNILTEITSKYNIRFIDYSSNPLCLDKSKFYNATHLNITGATIFSEQLASDLLK